MTFKCPHCLSTKTNVNIQSMLPPLPSYGFQAFPSTQENCYQGENFWESEFQEYVCSNCGIVTKISTQYYKEPQKRLSNDLMRDTLLSVEKRIKGTYPHGIAPCEIFDDLAQYTTESIEYCLDRLDEKHFIKRNGKRVIQIFPEGNEFLDTYIR